MPDGIGRKGDMMMMTTGRGIGRRDIRGIRHRSRHVTTMRRDTTRITTMCLQEWRSDSGTRRSNIGGCRRRSRSSSRSSSIGSSSTRNENIIHGS